MEKIQNLNNIFKIFKLQNLQKPNDNLTRDISNGDPYRDSFVRVFGYSHIIGQTTENLVCRPNFTKLCTSVSLLYCVCDAYDKYSQALNTQDTNKKGVKTKKLSNKRNKELVDEMNQYKPYIAAGNAVIWQSLASYLVPAFAVNRITKISGLLVRKMMCSRLKRYLPPIIGRRLRYFLPPIIGLATIPFIMTPIDNGVTKLIEIGQTQKYLEKDNYRDIYIRFLGYSYVISKTAFPAFHKAQHLIDMGYGVSVLYSFADAIDKCHKSYLKHENINLDKNNKKINSDKIINVHYKYQTIITAVDVLIWQGLASFVLPSYILSGIRVFTRKAIKRVNIKGNIRKKLPALIALSALPFIIIPIDRIVDSLLDHTYRKLI